MLQVITLLFFLQHIFMQYALGQKLGFTVNKDISDNIRLYFYSGPTFNDRVILKLEDGLNLAESRNFDATKQTMFYYHGCGTDATSTGSKALAKAFLGTKTANFVSFEYSGLTTAESTSTNYVRSVYNATYIGQAIGEFFKYYIPEKQPLHLIRMVAHSLGAQIMAKVAEVFGVGKLPHITGLDPVGPLQNISCIKSLEKNDAKFVDIIHTDGGAAGDFRTFGTVDFFPNKGTGTQPGCKRVGWHLIANILTDSGCSHRRAYVYYAESIVNGRAFPAKLCDRTLLSGYCCCNNRTLAYMGYNVSASTHGTFYLQTNSKKPFGKGLAGINF